MAAELTRHYGFARAVAIPNGRDAAHYRVGSKEPFVLTCGRIWDAGKNLQLLDEVAAQVEWPVYAAGAVRSPDGNDAGIRNMRPLGRLSAAALADWYSRAAVYALPAVYEPFGLSVLEAALSGCALVLADTESLRENWDGAALFADPHDTAAWAYALRRITKDEPLRVHLAAEALRRSCAFTSDRFANDYMELYRQASINTPIVQEARQLCAS
jgi:glycosyltransferase involved in cell wall biosynthesis